MHFFTDTGHNFYVHIQKFLDTILRIHKYTNAFYGILFNFLQITRNLISLIHVLKISFITRYTGRLCIIDQSNSVYR